MEHRLGHRPRQQWRVGCDPASRAVELGQHAAVALGDQTAAVDDDDGVGVVQRAGGIERRIQQRIEVDAVRKVTGGPP